MAAMVILCIEWVSPSGSPGRSTAKVNND